ncbi:restriction endonuclease subunit S [Hydrogenophaga sp. NH-16]|uniref:restriction endonuclease subunit S n=1 Tax=Hydrogenophaga sp. NH-16 TaxID=2184519 RepID=UPI000FD928AC|nr:restriction endonuclease subunit S [Hydrogenophaga sp. NH-16]
MSELPTGWVTAPIGRLCTLLNGRAFKPTEWAATGLPIVRIQNLNNPEASYNHYRGEVSERHQLQGGELLFAWSGTPGTSFGAHIWHGKEAALNQHIFRVDFDSAVLDKRFFRFAINEKLNELIGVAQGGVGLRHVTKGVFEGTEVVVPPRLEQTRIADQLDTLLARIRTCKLRLEAIPYLLKRFRRAVLDAATSGQLTSDWRDNSGGCAPWSPITVGEVLVGKPRNGYSPKAVDFETPVRSLTLSATTSGRFLSQHTKFIDEQISDDSHLWLEPGDILIQRANSLDYVGVSAVFDGPRRTFIYPDLMMKCRPNERVLGKYLYYVLSAERTRKYFRDNATGTAGNMPKINQQTVMSAPFDLPTLEEQAEIVRRVEAFSKLVEQIEARHSVAVSQVQRLPSLTLAKAFRGELVQQNPQDEPASVLLQRIAGKQPEKLEITRGRPRIKKLETVEFLPVALPDWSTLPAGVWAAQVPADEHTATALLTAVLKAWNKPMPQDTARLATLLCLQPRLLTAALPAEHATQWRRLVGDAAAPLPARVVTLQPAFNTPWRNAISKMRARGDLVETGSGAQGTWALGPDAKRVDTVGWPDGRAGWVMHYLQTHGVEAVLPTLATEVQEFVHARAA